MGTRRECYLCHHIGTDVKRYTIDYVDIPRRLTVNLCPDHNEALESLNAEFPVVKRSRRREEREPPTRPMELTSEWRVKKLRRQWRQEHIEEAPE